MKNFFEKLKDFFENEPNFNALFQKTPKDPRASERVRKRNKRNIFFFLFFPLSVLYMEIVYNYSLGNGLPIVTLLLISLFSLAFGFLITGIAMLLPLKVNRIFTLSVLTLTTLVIVSQCVYFNIFGDYYTISMMDLAGEAMGDFTDVMISSINHTWFTIVLLFIPLAIFIAKFKQYAPAFAPTLSFRIYLLVAALLCHLLAVGIVGLDKAEVGNGNYHYYYRTFETKESVKRFGVVTTMRLDAGAAMFGFKDDEIELPEETFHNPFVDTPEETTTGEAEQTDVPEETTAPAVSNEAAEA